MLCQQLKDEPFHCSANSKRADSGAGDRYTAHNNLEFSTLYVMSINANMEAINEGDGIESAFIKHESVLHKNCGTKFSSDKLERAHKAHKRNVESDPVTCDPSPVKTRCNSMASKQNLCLSSVTKGQKLILYILQQNSILIDMCY